MTKNVLKKITVLSLFITFTAIPMTSFAKTLERTMEIEKESWIFRDEFRDVYDIVKYNGYYFAFE